MFKRRVKQRKRISELGPYPMYQLPFTNKAQVILEFTFCMIIIMLMIYGVTKVMIWTGRDFAGRITSHDQLLRNTTYGADPGRQIDPYFYTPVEMNAIFGESN